MIQPSRFAVSGPPPEGDPHRYWRMFFPTAANTGANAVEMRETIGGPNVAVGGTPSASSQYNSSFSAAAAFDGNASTFWNNAGNAGNNWLAYDFGAGNAKAISEIVYQYNDAGHAPPAVQIQFSDDGATWTNYSPVFTVQGTRANSQHRVNKDNMGVLFRLTTTDKDGADYAAIREIDFDGASLLGFVTAPNAFSFVALNAVDGDTATRWVSSNIPLPTILWCGAKGSLSDYANVRITGYYNAAGADRTPKGFTIERSIDNGVTWVTMATHVGARWTDFEVRTFPVI